MPQQGEVLVESSGSRPGMQLNMLQCSAQPPTTEDYLAPNVKSAEAEKLCSTPTTRPQTGFLKGRPQPSAFKREEQVPTSTRRDTLPQFPCQAGASARLRMSKPLPLSAPTLLALYFLIFFVCLFAKYSGKYLWATVSPTTEI